MNEVVAWILAHWKDVLLAIQAIMAGALGIALLVPGEQPDKTIQWIVDMLKKLSLK